MSAGCQVRRAAILLGIVALLLVLIVPAGPSAVVAVLVPLHELLRPATSFAHRDNIAERAYSSISLTIRPGRAPPVF